MSDIIDIANEIIERDAELLIAQRRRLAQQIPAGTAGECDLCGEWSGRLADGVCATCRDRHSLP